MNLHSQGFNVVRSVGSPCEITQVELNLVPAFVQTHGHCANEGLHTGGALVVACPKASADILVVEDLDFEGEVLFEILDDHNEEWQFDSEGLVGVGGTGNVVGGDVGAHDFEDGALDIRVSDTLDVTVADALVPNLEGLRTKDITISLAYPIEQRIDKKPDWKVFLNIFL